MTRLTACFLVLSTVAAPAQISARQAHEAIQYVEQYAIVYGVPVELVEALIDVESGWNPRAVSSKGAAGIMQLMPQTARRFAVSDRFRLDENIRGGVAYLALLKEEFHGDLRLITAAYYIGERPIAARGLDYSSPDVQDYVRRVASRYRSRRLLRTTRACDPR
jgi:soluble lytic murein transglycosylase-like protein